MRSYYIRNRLLNVEVSADNDRQMMILFYETMSMRIPLFAYRLNKFMTEKMSTNPKISNPISARSREQLSSSKNVQRQAHELLDGWYITLNANYKGFIRILSRIGEAFGLKFEYHFHGQDRNV